MEKHEQEIYDKIEEIYTSVDKDGKPKGKYFITHLINSYFPVDKGTKVFDKKEVKMVCAITGTPLISVEEIWDGIHQDDFGKKMVQHMQKQFKLSEEGTDKEIESPMQEVLKGRVLAYQGKDTTTYLCTEAYQQLYNWLSTKILHGDKHIYWVMKKMRENSMINYIKKTLPEAENKPKIKRVEELVAKPKKTTFGDLAMLQELKQKMEEKEKEKS